MELQEFITEAEHQRSQLLNQAMHYLGDADSAEDAAQETLIKLWLAKDRIPDASKMRNMASVICKNVSLNILRDTKCHVAIERAESVAGIGNPENQLVDQENLQNLQQSIRSLSDKQRAIIRMRNVENLSYADIAKIIGTTESSVRGMISKARLELLNKMKGAKL